MSAKDDHHSYLEYESDQMRIMSLQAENARLRAALTGMAAIDALFDIEDGYADPSVKSSYFVERTCRVCRTDNLEDGHTDDCPVAIAINVLAAAESEAE